METYPHKKWNIFVQLDYHEGIFLTGPVPVPGFAWHLGGGVLAMPFYGLGENKYNEGSIIADGEEIVSRGHQPQFSIMPHWNLFPFPPWSPNVLIPLLIAGSSSKCEFAVGSVRGSDGPIAVSIGKWVGLNLARNNFCLLPTCAVFNSSTVILGFTFGDFVASLICAIFDIIKGIVEDKLSEMLFSKLPKGLFKGQMLSFLGAIGMPKVFRLANGQFASMSEKLVSETVEQLVKNVYGKFVGGSWGDKNVNPLLNSNPLTGLLTGESVTGENGLANHVGDWIDGRAELLP